MLGVLFSFLRRACLQGLSFVALLFLLTACGGSAGSSNQSFSNANSNTSILNSSSLSSSSASSLESASSVSSSTSSSSSADFMVVSGIVTFDYIPHNTNNLGLNYSRTEPRPVRGAVIELIDELGQIKASGITAEDGSYALSIQKNLHIKVRVKAQLLKVSAPSWDFKVTDNTSNNALYVLEGALVSATAQSAKRNLHAMSGWDGSAYSASRAAAPFAILDSIYVGLGRIVLAGNQKSLNPLELRWSTKNSAAEGDISKGEIGTSYYDGSSIYILGDANNDTDEYDPHVLLHEWGHYIEDELFRSDSIGGEHSDGQLLDLRVAMSEGFANAFSGMMIDRGSYADASGAGQASGFAFNIGRKSRENKGYFSEGSVGSILYNYYSSSQNKAANDFAPIFNILNNNAYTGSEAFTSIFLFQSQLKNQFPNHLPLFSNLMLEQSIFGTDEYASDESNNGGLSVSLPVYKTVNVNGAAINLCSAADYGKYNKLGNSQFVKLNITQSSSYSIRINKSGGANVISKPEFFLYQKGTAIAFAENTLSDNATASLILVRGKYLLEIYDANNRDSDNTEENMTCFNVNVSEN